MSKCEHGVYRREYCQVCTPGCGGGIMTPPPPADPEEPKKTCMRCWSNNISFDFQTETIYCLECGFDFKL
jgi:hypothetical protein